MYDMMLIEDRIHKSVNNCQLNYCQSNVKKCQDAKIKKGYFFADSDSCDILIIQEVKR